MAQHFLASGRNVFGVLVDEHRSGGYKLAQLNGGTWDPRGDNERLAAMKRLYLKMVAAYPQGDVELVRICPIDADQITGGTEAPEQMSRDALIAEVKRLRK